MTEYRQIPGVETRFTKCEIRALISHFHCKTNRDLRLAALRYESLFFMFNPMDHGIDLLPGDDMELILALAEHYVFENFSQTDQPLTLRYRERPRRGPGRERKDPLPDDLFEKFEEARKHVSTDEAAVQRLKFLGIIPNRAVSLKAKTILRYMQKDKQEKQKRAEEQHRRYLQAIEDFKDVPGSE